MTDNEMVGEHKPELIPALENGYAIGVKCLGCKWFLVSSSLPNETLLNDFYNEHADRQAITNRLGGMK